MIFFGNCFNYCDPKTAFFSSDERKGINKIHKLKEKYPDEITIIAEPKDNDGCIYCRLPVAWLRVQPKIKREMSEEQKAAFVERMGNLHK